MAEIHFRRDTSFRKQVFVPDSFAHPAKMDAQLLMWLVSKYTEPNETILDPMAGSGTTMLACTFGRHAILVELEEKFCKMMRDNWELVKMKPQLGCQMGTCQIIQGDARNLEGLLADKIITSPPYAESVTPYETDAGKKRMERAKRKGHTTKSSGILRAIRAGGAYAGFSEGYSKDTRGQIGNLPYGDIDKIITSPPFVPDDQRRTRHIESDDADEKRGFKPMKGYRSYYSQNPDNIGNPKSYGNIDSIITSPPWEDTLASQNPDMIVQRKAHTKKNRKTGAHPQWYSPESLARMAENYGENPNNIGNLKSDTYLEAMLQVYQQCFKVLKDGGLMILVTKNFIRNKKVVRLDTDTIKLCEQAGFSYVERHWRKLPAQSFWRIIYQKKHPEVEQIRYEDVLVFKKQVMELS